MVLSLQRLVSVAVVVRAAYLAVTLLLARYLDDYDTSASLLSESCHDNWPEVVAKHQQQFPLVVWDSVFLHRIAVCGYEYEQYFAFFPGLPGLVYLIRSAGLLSGTSLAFTVATLVINNLLFLLSVVLLVRLGQHFLQDDSVAATAVLMFIANPASIHHSMLYTEALFTASSWLGLYCLYCQNSSLCASLAFAVSAATRSNGLLNAGFILHEHGRRFLLSFHQQHDKSHPPLSRLQPLLSGAFFAAVSVSPYVAYTYFGYKMFCTGVYGGAAVRPWCHKTLPSAYGYVQDVYWDVGLFKFYRWDQTHNFLIAAPTLMISFWGVLAYSCACPHHLLTGGMLSAGVLAQCFSWRQRRVVESGSSSKAASKRSSSGGGGAGSSGGGGGGGGGGNALGSSGHAGVSNGGADPAVGKQKQRLIVWEQHLSLVGANGHSKEEPVAGREAPFRSASPTSPDPEKGERRPTCYLLSPVVVACGMFCGSRDSKLSIDGVVYQPLRLRQHEVMLAHERQQQQQRQHLRSLQGGDRQRRQQQLLQQKRTAYEAVFGQQVLQQRNRRNLMCQDGGVAVGDSGRVLCGCGLGKCYYSPGVAVFVIHWGVLMAVCVAIMHIQVATRFLSSCVPLYWFAALLMLHKGFVLRWLLWWYCFAFMGIGAVFFPNFFPWT